ncbi:putative disease resistance protein RGA3 [Bienertia sinuspersici]
MAESVLFGIAQEVLKNLGSAALNEIASAWGYKAQLNKLKNTINTLKNVLLDAEQKQADSLDIRDWLERLTTVVYAADDLFDEFTALASRKQLLGGNNVTKKVRTFFSSSNQIALAFKISRSIKNIRQELNDIVQDGTQFSFVLRPHEVITNIKRDETYSYVDVEQVIGRDGDKKAILDLLLPSSCAADVHEHVELPVIPIVGIGGMGKTSLAQLIYNDPQVQVFFDLRLWVCVSDVFDIKAITEKLLMSATYKETQNLGIEQLQGQLRNVVGDKKYLLVMDDVWNEKRDEWLKLRDLLKICRKGSKILVTTRSKEVAEIMGTSPAHELLGLSEEKSWDLFEKWAFKHGQAEEKPNLVKVGREIVKKCAYVPLAIRTLGSLLYGREESKWLSIRDTSLANIPDYQNGVMKILKISYDHLWSPLKNCFAYCAMFSKDYEFDKEMLIELWMAEGFVAANEGQCLEEVAEEYFLILLQRGFFQDILRNEWGDIEKCKMHDLMHDLAKKMAGVKCKVANFGERIVDDKILHLSLAYMLPSLREIPNCIRNLKLLRTLLLPEQSQEMMDMGSLGKSTCPQLLMRFSSLRVLDVSRLDLKKLPSSIGKLIHLRYLNLSFTAIEKLPDSITKLWNLQTLRLRCCWNLRALPSNMRMLTNLRSLDVMMCDELTHMPSGIEKLTSLSKLPRFIVGHESSKATLKLKTTSTAKLSDLKNLNNLRGELEIVIHRNLVNNMLEAAEADLSCKHGLTDLKLIFSRENEVDVNCDHDEAVLEGLKPHSDIRNLHINRYNGMKPPSWARLDNLCFNLPNLVKIRLGGGGSCQQLPIFSKLRFLKSLQIYKMEAVEYMESGECDVSSISLESQDIESLFFPSLEELELKEMKNLKGWWKGEAIECDHEIEGSSYESSKQLVSISMQFSKLSTLVIWGCPNLRVLPLCPSVESLTLRNTNESLSVSKMATSLSSSTAMSSSSAYGLKLKSLTIDNAEDLLFLPSHCLYQLSFLMVIRDRKLESSARLGELFTTVSSSLQYLQLDECDKLRSISKGLEHLTALENLVFYGCKELDIAEVEDEDENGMPWKALNTSLRSLQLRGLPKLVGLPKGLRHLANLRSLQISDNDELKELPEWISCLTCLVDLSLFSCPKLKSLPEAFCNLTALVLLRIVSCPGLTERCQHPNGSDWPKIQHIPIVSVLESGLLIDLVDEYQIFYLHAVPELQ